MKLVIPFLLLLIAPFSSAQSFHFEDTCTTLIKNTSQSPAHWYIEIFNDLETDTLLRWKAHFEDIPAAWNINFDTQTQNWPTVNDGDSADFVLLANPDFPQKLIIGAMLNNTPGHGTVFFDIYDPDFPSYKRIVCYEFIVTPFLGLDALQDVPFIRLKENILEVTNGQETRFDVYALDGRQLAHGTSNDSFTLSGIAPQTVIVYLQQDEKHYIIRTFIR